MYYLISNEKHFYCREGSDLLVVDPDLVKIGDTVQFTFGAKSYEGNVLSASETEEDVLTHIQRLTKERKLQKEASASFSKKGASFSKKVRKSAKAQRDKMRELFSVKGVTKKPTKQKSQKKVLEEAKEAAENAMEENVQSSSSDQESDSSGSQEGSDSGPSSLDNVPLAAKIAGKRKDLKDLQLLSKTSNGQDKGMENGGSVVKNNGMQDRGSDADKEDVKIQAITEASVEAAVVEEGNKIKKLQEE